ncbi:zinc-dependent peptidase [Porticoccus sp. W117]|uniref:M90 family metallopeptidase n=1 Tax=Porticoccus sp. W117 TaxID=3054777 RepID=UPI0025964CA2|nr:M90 family metallopeptidase [Porticoccus sp. W117]MDM3869888.1 zinc-dependent peptidase [Porticoccus sp. W117]
MAIELYFAMMALIVASVVFWVWLLPKWRLQRAIKMPFPDEWEKTLSRNNTAYQRLSPAQQSELQHLIKIFLHNKHFVGCDGLVISDEIRLTVAAEACLLLLNRVTSVYGKLRYIYVYPSPYVAPHQELGEGGVVSHQMQGRAGESWQSDKVVLAWDEALHGVRNFDDGRNLILHEFAHQLDQESGSANGAPLMEKASSYRSWARVLSQEYETLQEDMVRGHSTLLDHYGATNPAEFFAVVTETFYEQPEQMAQQHPALFKQLVGYYKVDPREWQ